MNFSQEIYLVIGVLHSCIDNLTINQHCAWVPWLNALPSNKLKEDNSLFTSDNCQHQPIFLRFFHIVYESKRWAFVQPESISLQIIKKNYRIRFCLKSDGCKVISIAHHHIRKAGESNTKSKQKLWQRDTCLVELGIDCHIKFSIWNEWMTITWMLCKWSHNWTRLSKILNLNPHTQKSTILMMILSMMVQHYEPPAIEPFPNHNSEHKTDTNMAHVHWSHKQLANAHQPWSPSPTKD